MKQTGFLISVVVIGSVVWRYLRVTVQRDPLLSTTLTLIGFVLVSSPIWTSIVVKGPQWELSLLREQSTKQAEQYLALLEAYQKALPAAQAREISPAVGQVRNSVGELRKARDKEEQLKKLQEVAKSATEITTKVIALTVRSSIPETF
jgi:hypothetical protein